MSDRARIAVALLAAWGLVMSSIAAVLFLIGADLVGEQRDLLLAILRERAAYVIVVSLMLIAPMIVILKLLFDRYVAAPRRLTDDLRIMATANPAHRSTPAGAAEIHELGVAVNTFADAYADLQRDVERQVRAANARIEVEKNRLAALMSELTQSVVMCNLEGRILLYNQRAMKLLARSMPGENAAGKTISLVGLGRSVFAIFDRNLIIHALETVHEQTAKAVRAPVASFVTTVPSGQLVRVQLAPVKGAFSEQGDASGEAADISSDSITGFVLVLENITRRIEAGNRRDLLLQTLTQGTRASLGSIRAAIEMIAAFPDMAKEERDRFVGIVSDEAQQLTGTLDHAVNEFADSLRTDWPLEDMRGADLIAATARRIEAKVGIPVKFEEIDEAVWLKVDSYSLMQGITYLAARLREEFSVREVRFDLQAAGALAHLDLVWTGAPIGSQTVMDWQSDSMEMGGEASPLTLKQIVDRHDAELWCQIQKASHREFFRFAIPIARPEEAPWSAPVVAGSRPEFYDFDLFHQAGQTPELDNRTLASLAYTVFDTETTGLQPAEGDEIVSIGAARVVNSRLLEHEVFEQLIDPNRLMSPEASRITGIESSMLTGQPTIDKVLPAFRDFCEDTVLVAHNAAFDMRFLRMKEKSTGIAFTQPVLDTLLLSAVIHPHMDSHGLEAIAERLGVSSMGRHTALGDAIMTSEVFLRMLPLLEKMGIRTLGEARAASEKTYFARIEY